MAARSGGFRPDVTEGCAARDGLRERLYEGVDVLLAIGASGAWKSIDKSSDVLESTSRLTGK